MRENKITTIEAVDTLIESLKRDKGYYISWQANIAMAFYDECSINGHGFPDLHKTCNDAANRFLQLLMMDNTTKREQ